MAHLGVLLACEHYPGVSDRLDQIDHRLQARLERDFGNLQQMSVFPVYSGDLPLNPTQCDIWLVSGAVLDRIHTGGNTESALDLFLKEIAAAGTPLLGIYHGEHAISSALAPTRESQPTTRKCPLSIRNPIRNTHRGDKLFRWVPHLQILRTIALRQKQTHRPGTFAALLKFAA
jgi:hypothetical protein